MFKMDYELIVNYISFLLVLCHQKNKFRSAFRKLKRRYNLFSTAVIYYSLPSSLESFKSVEDIKNVFNVLLNFMHLSV